LEYTDKEGTMRNVFLAIVVALCIAVPNVSAELKIGYVDSKGILAKYQGLAEAQSKLDKEVAKWDQNLSKRYKEIKDLKDMMDEKSLILSDERKKTLQDSLDQMVTQARQEERKIYGTKGDVDTKNEELSKPVIDKINQILARIAKEENFDFILDAHAGGGGFALPKYDLSERVLMLLNKEK
jgi:outer membrane protein